MERGDDRFHGYRFRRDADRQGGGLALADDETFECVVLTEPSGDRQLAIEIGPAEAFSLAAQLNGIDFGRPQVYQFGAAILAAVGGRVERVLVDRLVEGAESWDAGRGVWTGEPLAGAADWVSARARVVGGCCRVGPAEIGALAARLVPAAASRSGDALPSARGGR
jgi:hypothetical protein